MIDVPDTPVPFGGGIAVFGLVFLLGAVIAFCNSYVAFHREPPLTDEGDVLRMYGISFAIPALVLMSLGMARLARRMNIRERDRGRFGTTWTD